MRYDSVGQLVYLRAYYDGGFEMDGFHTEPKLFRHCTPHDPRYLTAATAMAPPASSAEHQQPTDVPLTLTPRV